MHPAALAPAAHARALALAELDARARAYAAAAHAPNTLRAYASDLRALAACCGSRGVASLPAERRTVALHLARSSSSGGPWARAAPRSWRSR